MRMANEFAIAFVIVGICVVIHTVSVVVFAEWLLGKRDAIERRPSLWPYAFLLSLVFAVLILLHIGETGVWAAFYYWRGLFADYETCLYFSLTSYTTIGYGDVVLPQTWRLVGAIEGISGVLLCGLSTAFVFAVVNALFRIRIKQRRRSRRVAEPGTAAKQIR